MLRKPLGVVKKMDILANLYKISIMPKVLSHPKSERPLDLPQLSSTELKSNTGEVLRQASKGAVAITRHDRTEFVILPAAQYEELISQSSGILAQMSDEFDALVSRMNTPSAAKGFQSLFSATPKELGRSAVARAKPHAR